MHGNLKTPFHLVDCTYQHNLDCLFKVEHTKSHMCPPGLGCRLMQMRYMRICYMGFSTWSIQSEKREGPLLRNYDTLTAAIATGMNCTGIENCSDVFNSALGRL